MFQVVIEISHILIKLLFNIYSFVMTLLRWFYLHACWRLKSLKYYFRLLIEIFNRGYEGLEASVADCTVAKMRPWIDGIVFWNNLGNKPGGGGSTKDIRIHSLVIFIKNHCSHELFSNLLVKVFLLEWT